MSTYLVAYAIGDFAFKEDTMNNVPKFRIVTRPSEIETAEQAITYGPVLLFFYEKYFDIKYPLPKMDMLAARKF